MEVCVETKRYLLKIRVKTPKGTLRAHQLVCFGLDSIAEIHKHVAPKQLQRFFPDVPLDELRRPKEISLLISHKEGQLAPEDQSCWRPCAVGRPTGENSGRNAS